MSASHYSPPHNGKQARNGKRAISLPAAWTVAKVLKGEDPGRERIDALPESIRHPIAYLAGVEPEQRGKLWAIIVDALGPIGRDIVTASLAVDAGSHDPPEDAAPVRPATLADIRAVMADTLWTWEGWIPSGRLFGIAAFEGVGKTRFALDLAGRIYHAKPWPDNQAPTLPKGTRSLWICSDGQHDELAEAAARFGLPDEALAFAATPEDPYGGTTIDGAETLALMERFLARERFGAVFIDSLTNATSRDLCVARDVQALGAPLRDLAQRHGVPIGLLLHLAKDGGVLGRRIRGLARTIIQLDAPDPASARLKLWVPKSYAQKPAPLGVTMGETGNAYDFDPPEAPATEPKPGRPNVASAKAVTFITGRLGDNGSRKLMDMLAEWESLGGSRPAFYRARDELVAAGAIVCDGKPKTLRRADPPADSGDAGE